MVFGFRKCYNSNRLLSGLLQLSSRTHLVLDETALQPGKLNNNGKIVFELYKLYNMNIAKQLILGVHNFSEKYNFFIFFLKSIINFL